MIVRNGFKVELFVKGIYEGPASSDGYLMTFSFNKGPKNGLFDGFIDGAPCTLKVKPIDGYDTIKRPFLQASIA